MKKNILASMTLGALMLVGCGGSMEDKEEKYTEYYKEHIEEAQNKIKWCLNKLNSDEKELEKVVNDVIKAGSDSVDSYYNLSMKMRNGGSDGLEGVDASNCIYSLKAYVENELEKVKK